MITSRSEWDKKKAIRAQQKRDVNLRRERREDIQAHEMQGLTTKEIGEDRRTQARGEFAGARQESVNRAGLQQMGMQQRAETGRAEMQQAGETARTTQRQEGLQTLQASKFGEQRGVATLADERSTSRFHKELGAKAYLGGQDPRTASQLAASGPRHTSYEGLKAIPPKPDIKAFDEVRSDRDQSLIRSSGYRDQNTGEQFFDDEERLKKQIALLKEDEEKKRYQGLR